MNPTTEQITALRTEAAAGGDLQMVRVCDRALAGSSRALRECARVIATTRAERAIDFMAKSNHPWERDAWREAALDAVAALSDVARPTRRIE